MGIIRLRMMIWFRRRLLRLWLALRGRSSVGQGSVKVSHNLARQALKRGFHDSRIFSLVSKKGPVADTVATNTGVRSLAGAGDELAQGGVYALRDPVTGQVVRSGRTNNLLRRQGEHFRVRRCRTSSSRWSLGLTCMRSNGDWSSWCMTRTLRV